MSSHKYVVALDQGTTSSRAILYDLEGRELKKASRELSVSFPQDGWVEQLGQDIWETQRDALLEAASGIKAEEIKCIGITNQRETTLCWDGATGELQSPAVVWQCRRSADICAQLRAAGLGELISKKTGLVIDAYFSATKIAWLLENISGLRDLTAKGSAVFGTVDSWIIYNLTKDTEKAFVTEPSNASRTMLCSLDGGWDDELLAVFELRRENLAKVLPSSGAFGTTTLLGAPVPITGVLGDQQASLFGHGCTEQGSVKCTFGTGAFLLLNSGENRASSEKGLLSTVAWEFGPKGSRVYAVEGSIFIAGAVVGWLQKNLQFFSKAADCEALAASVPDSGGVVMVPAFVGLGAPHWDSQARGSFFGLSRDTDPAHMARAALEGVAHQVADLFDAEEFSSVKSLSVDGAMAKNKLFCQLLSDFCQINVVLPARSEITAFGAAKIALLGAGYTEAETSFLLSAEGMGDAPIFSPQKPAEKVKLARKHWREAVSATRKVGTVPTFL